MGAICGHGQTHLPHRHVTTITTQFTGVFKTDATLRQRFLDFANRR